MKKFYALFMVCLAIAGTVPAQPAAPGNGNETAPALTGLVAEERYQTLELGWTALYELGTDRYEVLRSANGIEFVTIGVVAARNQGSAYRYQYVDAAPLTGTNYYRIRAVSVTGAVHHTGLVRIEPGKGKRVLLVNPNPVTDGQMTVQFQGLAKGRYSLDLYNAAGFRVFSRAVEHPGGSASQTLSLPASVSPGVYQLQLIGEYFKLTRTVQVSR